MSCERKKLPPDYPFRVGLFDFLEVLRGGELHLREIARRTNKAPSVVANKANELTKRGVLTRQKVGNEVLYALNTKSPVHRELMAISAFFHRNGGTLEWHSPEDAG